MTLVSATLKQLRRQKGWTLQAVAATLRISLPAIYKIESGKSDISYSRLLQFAELYQVPVSALFGNAAAEGPYHTLTQLRLKLRQREQELNALQAKLIELHEEVRS
ncbi:hypothetical protein GCM10023149_21420 [Mucilaginibacter gynuensis]|uniref:HTH cro/C1-type domain-containing protein n=2 Tax=Mucilaginibacter gynuensis TaxID=1302236 RepID=A0ABP8GCT6_9SPHI